MRKLRTNQEGKDFLPSKFCWNPGALREDLRGTGQSGFCGMAPHSPNLKTVLIWGQETPHHGNYCLPSIGAKWVCVCSPAHS